MTVSESRRPSEQGEFSATFDSLLGTYNRLSRVEDIAGRSNLVGKETRQRIFPDGLRVTMDHTKGDSRSMPQQPERLFANITNTVGTGSSEQLQQVVTFSLQRDGLTDICIYPVTLTVEVGDIKIPHYVGKVEIRKSRLSPDGQQALKSASPAMVEWAMSVVKSETFSTPPYTLSAQQ